MPPLVQPTETDGERIVRLEEQIRSVQLDLAALRAEQREHAATISRAVGGAKVLLLLSSLGGLLTVLHAMIGVVPFIITPPPSPH